MNVFVIPLLCETSFLLFTVLVVIVIRCVKRTAIRPKQRPLSLILGTERFCIAYLVFDGRFEIQIQNHFILLKKTAA